MSFAAKATLQARYTAVKTTTNAASSSAKGVNSSSMSTPAITTPTRIHGLNLPHRVRVLSTSTPTNGSMTASKTRTATSMTVTLANTGVDTARMSDR